MTAGLVTVRVPVRVCVDVTDDRVGDPALVEYVRTAVDAATGRAVAHARTIRLVRDAVARGCPDGPRLHLTWRGDALPDPVARQLDQTVAGCVAAAAIALGVGVDPDSAQPDVVVPAHEELDESRLVDDALIPGEDAYLVPSYDHGGNRRPVHVQGRPSARGRRPRPPAVVIELQRLDAPEAIWYTLARRDGGTPRTDFAVLHANADGQPTLSIVDVASDGSVQSWASTPLTVWRPPVGTGAAQLTGFSLLQADTFRLRAVARGAPAQLTERAAAWRLGLARAFPTAQATTLDEQARLLARDIPQNGMTTTYFYELVDSATVVWIGEFAGPVRGDQRPVLTLTKVVSPQEGEQRRYGANCPPLDVSSLQGWIGAFGLFHDNPTSDQSAFLDEPPLEAWPPDLMIALRQRMAVVCQKLHTSPTRFVGAFLISAMVDIDKRCRRLVSSGAPMRYQIEEMASSFGPVKDLADLYGQALRIQDGIQALPCPLAGQSVSWLEHFWGIFGAARDDAVASLFVSMCQQILLHTLVTSRRELVGRATNFDRYMRVTRLLLTATFTDTGELAQLREALSAREHQISALAFTGSSATGGGTLDVWLAATSSLIDEFDPATHAAPEHGTVARRQGTYRVYDGKGRWYSGAELDALLAAERQQAVGLDPLLEKVSDVPEVLAKLRAAHELDLHASAGAGRVISDAVDEEFRQLLADLIEENDSRTKQAANNRKIAFGLASFTEEDANTKDDVGAKLYGIHKLADERLRPMFTDPDAYVTGLRQLVYAEISKSELWEFVNFVGLAALSVFCPPLAFAVGAVEALEGLDTALEHRGIQRAMLDGDAILSKAQVEAELWGAAIGVALTFVPEVPSLARGAASETRALVRGESLELAEAAARQALRRISEHMAQMSVEHFTKRFIAEVTKSYLINLALSKAIGRVTDAVAEQVARTGKAASVGDIGAIVSQALAGTTGDGS